MRINREYAEMFQDYAGNKANQTTQMKEAVQFVKQKLDSAQWFIDASSSVKRLCSVRWKQSSFCSATSSSPVMKRLTAYDP